MKTRCKQATNTDEGINWACGSEIPLTHAISEQDMTHTALWGAASEHNSSIVWLLLNIKTHLQHTDGFSPSKTWSQFQSICIVCLHCMIIIKKTYTVHKVTANVISFQWGGRFCLCTLAPAHNEISDGTTAACILSFYWYSIMAVLSRLNNIYME